MKIKNNIKLIDNTAKFKYMIPEAEKAAMKELGKMLVKLIVASMPSGWVKIRKLVNATLYRKDISIRLGFKRKGFYGTFLELGTDKMKPKPVFVKTVEANIDLIQKEICRHITELGK